MPALAACWGPTQVITLQPGVPPPQPITDYELHAGYAQLPEGAISACCYVGGSAHLQGRAVQVALNAGAAPEAVPLQVADVPRLHRHVIKAEPLPAVRQALLFPHLTPMPATLFGCSRDRCEYSCH